MTNTKEKLERLVKSTHRLFSGHLAELHEGEAIRISPPQEKGQLVLLFPGPETVSTLSLGLYDPDFQVFWTHLEYGSFH